MTNHYTSTSDGSKLGCRFEYKIQPEPNGLAQAFIIGKISLVMIEALILGDNFSLAQVWVRIGVFNRSWWWFNFCLQVNDPERYGVVELDENENVLIEEKPKQPNQILLYQDYIFITMK